MCQHRLARAEAQRCLSLSRSLPSDEPTYFIAHRCRFDLASVADEQAALFDVSRVDQRRVQQDLQLIHDRDGFVDSQQVYCSFFSFSPRTFLTRRIVGHRHGSRADCSLLYFRHRPCELRVVLRPNLFFSYPKIRASRRETPLPCRDKRRCHRQKKTFHRCKRTTVTIRAKETRMYTNCAHQPKITIYIRTRRRRREARRTRKCAAERQKKERHVVEEERQR